MSRLKIAITINYLAVGGSQSFALALAQGLADRGHEVYLYDFNLPIFTDSLEKLNSPLLNFRNVTLKKFKIPPPFLFYNQLIYIKSIEKGITWLLNKFRVRSFKKFLIDNRINIASSHLMGADTLTGFAVLNLPNVKHVATMHGSYEGFPNVSITKREVIFSRVDGVVYLTPRNLEFLDKLDIKKQFKIRQIYNGYIPQIFKKDAKAVTRKELNIPEDSFVFIQVARGSEDKGWQETINAFLKVQQKTYKSVRLLLVGDGHYLTELKPKYQNHKGIIFYGYSGNPIPLITIADVGLLPSYYPGESLPNTVIEYLYLGKPVLGSNKGEISNMIGVGTESPAGFTFDLINQGPIDDDALAKKMLEYINNKELYNLHSSNTSAQSQKFEMDNCVKSYEDFFLELVNDQSQIKTN